MVKTKSIVSLSDVKGQLEQGRDFLKELMKEVIEDALEQQMDETLGLQKGERTSEDRLSERILLSDVDHQCFHHLINQRACPDLVKQIICKKFGQIDYKKERVKLHEFK